MPRRRLLIQRSIQNPSSDFRKWKRSGAIFEERKREVEKAKDRCFYWFVVNIILLFLIAVLIFIGLATGGLYLFFLAGVRCGASARLFGYLLPCPAFKAREYREEYSFKNSRGARRRGFPKRMLKEDMGGKGADEAKRYGDFVGLAQRPLCLSKGR